MIPAGLPSDLPLPKKAFASIRDVSASAGREKPPDELVRILEKTLQNVGDDIAADFAHVFSPLIKRWAHEFQKGTLADAVANINAMLGAVTRDNPTFSATVPIVLERFDTQKSEVIGSGVLVRIINRTFLLTAAHVTDHQSEGTLLIPGQHGFMPVRGRFSAMRLPASGRRADDKLDVAYYWLEDDCLGNLHSNCIILERPDASLEAEALRRTTYTFAGFPWRKSNVTRGIIETDSWTLSGVEAKKSEYEALGLTRSRHIAIRFHRRRAFHEGNRKVMMAPLPHGMSGGGVYAWSDEAMRTWPVRLPLVGIANEYVPERSLLIATRLHVYVGCIFYNQPHLAAMANG